MGFDTSWLAVRGKPSESVLHLMGLRPTGEFEEVPESPIMGIAAANRLVSHLRKRLWLR